MKVVVAGLDYPARPHITSFLTRAFRRLGCEVVRAGPGATPCNDPYIDPYYEPPTIITSGQRVPCGAVSSGANLVVMVDQGDDWCAYNDGSAPFAYIWREGNPGEDRRVIPASSGAPLFCCMMGSGKANLPEAKFMPFAVEREFLDFGDNYESRDTDFIYTGRERGSGTNNRVCSELSARGRSGRSFGYISGYRKYAAELAKARTTFVMDSGRYIGSRGLEAMATGVVTFWDGGEAWSKLGFEFGRECLKVDRTTCPSSGEFMPTDDFVERIDVVCRNREVWTRISEAGRAAILMGHTYEHRALTIAEACGVKLPKTIQDVFLGDLTRQAQAIGAYS